MGKRIVTNTQIRGECQDENAHERKGVTWDGFL
jgi:hypothetical protein